MTISPGEHPIQALRSRATDEIINVPARMDSKAGHYIVLWRDIQRVFENAKFVRNGTTLVSFMVDENFEELIPQRIAYYLGVELEVVVGKANATDSSEVPSLSDQDSTSSTTDMNQGDISDDSHMIISTDSSGQHLVKYGNTTDETQSSLRAYSRLYDSYFQVIVSGQESQATYIKESINQHFDRLQVDMVKNKVLQDQLVHVQRELLQLQQQTHGELLIKLLQMEQLQDQTRKELIEKQQETVDLQRELNNKQKTYLQLQQDAKDLHLKKQEEMLELQRRTLNRLIVILNRVQTLLTQTYELHEYPVPRLFIVLPKATGFRDKFTGLLSEQFRLYFLCECGTHTMPEGSKVPHEIHLAKHDGYDLERPKEFFAKYGSYLMAMMCMIKYGVIAGGLVVPPLSNLKIVEGLDTTVKFLRDLKKDIVPLVDDTISFLQNTKGKSDMSTHLRSGSGDPSVDNPEALEGADLRQLESYLQVKDKGRVLGNLYRIVTPEGHVKWVCFDHYRANSREGAIKHLRDVVSNNRGRYIEETGKIVIRPKTSMEAKELYDAMIKAHGIQELDIQLQWDASMDELRELRDAITKSNVIRLTMGGSNLRMPAVDVVYRGKRFDPILQLLYNGRLQYLWLDDFEDFFGRVSKMSLVAPRFRVFSVSVDAPWDDNAARSFTEFLEHCTGLRRLVLRIPENGRNFNTFGYYGADVFFPITNVMWSTLTNNRQFETLELRYWGFNMKYVFRDGKVHDGTLTIPSILSITRAHVVVIVRQQITRLVIGTVPGVSRAWDSGDYLSDILFQCSGLKHIQISFNEEMGFDTEREDEMRLRSLMEKISRAKLSKLESLSVDYGRFVLSGGASKSGEMALTLRFMKFEDLTYNDLEFIQRGPYTQLAIVYHHEDARKQLVELLCYRSELTHVHVRYPGTRRLVFVMTASMNFGDLMKMATSRSHGNTPDKFSIYRGKTSLTGSFSKGKMQDLTMTIENLGGLGSKELEFIQDHPTRLAIRRTPVEAEERQLVNILRDCQKLNHLQIGCQPERALAMIDLVLSTRRKILQEGGSSGLDTFGLMKEGLCPFDALAWHDKRGLQIQSFLSFHGDSESFDMRSWIRLQDKMNIFNEHAVYDFIRRFGWSIVVFDEGFTANNTFAAILDEIPNTKSLQLESLWIDPKDSSIHQVRRMDRIMRRSGNVRDLGVYMDFQKLPHIDDFKSLHTFLIQFGAILSKLQLNVNNLEQLSWIAALPPRSTFPKLESLELYAKHDMAITSNCLDWIVSMISAPPPRHDDDDDDGQQGNDDVDSESSSSSLSWRPLKMIGFCHIQFSLDGLKSLLDAMDLTRLEKLDLRGSPFSSDQFDLVAEHISNGCRVGSSLLPLLSLRLTKTKLTESAKSKRDGLVNIVRD
ncbi:hypothetical protein B0O80DRAFT_531998 [Mortierella sp. GBAus27b]|nr:hypothetical protein BGX31_007410 [Mortierella sp. GBA43]KAI8349162.1 hypothetical protein B0O80DRAFT_531998 [Mortierella sp. GBAus27b]